MSKLTFFWYDLETSGVNPREDRVMQFAGQRTDMDLQPIGEPVNVLIKLGDDVLPAPDAVLLTGITPQQTLQDGVTEAEFLAMFTTDVATPGTIFVGFNSVRFDDEFMRYLHYRNYYDPYEWQWRDGRSRWDILDVVRMTRALRPEGIRWPVVDGKPGNRLELLTEANNIGHEDAHDALADVRATIELARLIQHKQPKLFTWLLNYRDKKEVAKLVDSDKPFVYSSGKYANEYEKTTVAVRIAGHPKKKGALVYDLRHDPTEFLHMSPQELAERWRWTKDADAPTRLPVKTMQYNRCPAAAPLGVLDDASKQRIGLDEDTWHANEVLLKNNPRFVDSVLAALEILDAAQEARQKKSTKTPEARLYDGFYDSHDTNLLGVVRAAEPNELSDELGRSFHDARLKDMLLGYKARNYASQLSDEEHTRWDEQRYHLFMDGGTSSWLARYMHRLAELSNTTTDTQGRYVLEELQLYAESILPVADTY